MADYYADPRRLNAARAAKHWQRFSQEDVDYHRQRLAKLDGPWLWYVQRLLGLGAVLPIAYDSAHDVVPPSLWLGDVQAIRDIEHVAKCSIGLIFRTPELRDGFVSRLDDHPAVVIDIVHLSAYGFLRAAKKSRTLSILFCAWDMSDNSMEFDDYADLICSTCEEVAAEFPSHLL